jgi:molybdopterin molybdotransferase
VRPVAEHRSHVLSLVEPLGSQTVPVAEAGGRVLGADVRAASALPRWDSSSMDGFAVRSADLVGAGSRHPVVLEVVGEVAAGSAGTPQVGPGTAVRIMTGAPVPPGADAVVRQEDTDRGVAAVAVRHAAQPGDYVRLAGGDVAASDLVLAAGTVLGPPQLAAAVAAGVAEVRVLRRPRVAVVSTGAELAAPGVPLARGQVHDSNGVLLAAASAAAGAEVVAVRAVGDDVAALRAVLAEVAAGADLVLTSGGVSVGDYDVVKAALAPQVEFVEVAMQPGKPQGAGRLPDGTPVLCLPGNPVSAFVCFEVVARPALLAMRGLHELDRPTCRAVLADGWRTPPGRAQYMPVVLEERDSDLVARRAVPGGSGSHLVAGLALADGLAVVPADVAEVHPGETVTVIVTGRWTSR